MMGEQIQDKNPDVSKELADPLAHKNLEPKATRVKPTADRAVEVAGARALQIDPMAGDRFSDARAGNSAPAGTKPGLNSIGPDIEKERRQLSAAGTEAAPARASEKRVRDNHVESDEIFTASQPDARPVAPAEMEPQYLPVGNKFYQPNNTEGAAVTDKGNKLETKSNSEQVAETMVRIAEARGWDEIKVSGSETFRREVWLEAAARGMHVKGYAPTKQDKTELAKRVKDAGANQMEKENPHVRGRESESVGERQPSAQAMPVVSERARSDRREQQGKVVDLQDPETYRDTLHAVLAQAFRNEAPEEGAQKHPELAGAYAAVSAIDKQAQVDGLNPHQRAVVMARVLHNTLNSIERGRLPKVKVKETVEEKLEAENEQQ